MSENKTSIAAPAAGRNEIEIDLLDMLADLLIKWKAILAVLLIGAILGCGWALYSGKKLNKPVTDQQISSAKAKVASDRATAIEQLFFQYVSYKELQEETRAYYGSFASVKLDEDSVVRIAARYRVSSSIENLNTFLPDFVMTEKDYQALREIAPDEEWASPIYERVSISSVSNSRITVSNLNGESAAPIDYLFSVFLYGASEDQCLEMLSVLEKAFEREVTALKSLDPDITLTFAGKDFDHNMFDYVNKLRKSRIDQMTVAETEINSINTAVGNLPAAEKSYYNLLLQRYNEAFAAKKTVSWKKWTVVGAFLGAVLAAMVILLAYLLDGKVKAPAELEQAGPMLHRVYIKGKKNLFGKWAAGLIRADDAELSAKADIVSTDLSILMKKNGKNSLLLLCSKEDSDAFSFAELVKARLREKNDSLQVSIADPLDSVGDLELAAQADACVVFAELKKSRRSVLREWERICARYMLPAAGAVTVQRCW